MGAIMEKGLRNTSLMLGTFQSVESVVSSPYTKHTPTVERQQKLFPGIDRHQLPRLKCEFKIELF